MYLAHRKARNDPVGISQSCLTPAKTWTLELRCGEKIMTIYQAVSIGYRNVTDRQTDRQTELLYQYRASVCWSEIKSGAKTYTKSTTAYIHNHTKTSDKLLTDNCSHHEVYPLRNILINVHNTDVMHTCNWLVFLLELTSLWWYVIRRGLLRDQQQQRIMGAVVQFIGLVTNDNDKLNANWTYRILIGAAWRTAPKYRE